MEYCCANVQKQEMIKMKKNGGRTGAPGPVKAMGMAAALIMAALAAWWWAQSLPSHLPSYRTVRPALEQAPAPAPTPAEPQPPVIDWEQIDQQIVTALLQAESAAETTAAQKLDAWVAVLMRRVDEDFLDWYFSYWTQQQLSVHGMWRWGLDQVIGKESQVAENILEEIQEEFAWRVLRPDFAQRELEQIAQDAFAVFSERMSTHLAAIPSQHQIPPAEWDRYLADIAVLTAAREGNRRVSLSLKAITAGSAGGGIVLASALAAPLQNLGSKTSAKFAAKAAGKMASETGARVASRAGGRLLGLIIGVGIVMWEMWDHERTQELERPKLRQAIVEYFDEVQQNLLYDPEYGIIAILDIMRGNVLASLRTQPQKTGAATSVKP